MFNFISMADNYDSRKVEHFEEGELIIDTASVTDGSRPYETGICHPEYNGGSWVIVEAYYTKDDARAGHEKWVKTMTAENLPESLKDCMNAGISQLSEFFGGETEYPRVVKAK